MKNKLFHMLVALEILIIGILLFRAVKIPRKELIVPPSYFSSDEKYVNKTKNGIGITTKPQNKIKKHSILKSEPISLPSGSYQVTVNYYAVPYEDFLKLDSKTEQDTNEIEVLGTIRFSTSNKRALLVNPIQLINGHSIVTSRLWIRMGNHLRDLKIDVVYNGISSLVIKNIKFRESIAYRYARILLLSLFFIAINILFYFLGDRLSLKDISFDRKVVFLGLALIVFISSLVYFTDFLFGGHDLRFHLSRISYIAESIIDRQIPHRIQFTAKNGYGYPTPIFYSELLLYIPAILNCLKIPLQTCYRIYVILINIITCGISYWSFYKISKDWKCGLLGSCLYTLSTYRLINMMNRAAVGEYTAMSFLPLACYGLWNLYQNKRDDKILFSQCIPIILGFSGMIQSHILTCFMSIPFIIISLILGRKQFFSKNCFLSLTKSAIVILLLNVWFLYPMLESLWKLDLVSEHMNLSLEARGVYLVQIFSMFNSFSGSLVENGMKNEMPLSIGISLTLGLLLWMFLYIFSQKANSPLFKQATFFAVLSLIAIFLASNYFCSDMLIHRFKFLKILEVIQFPFRFLSFSTLFSVFSIILCLNLIHEEYGKRIFLKTAVTLVLPGLLSTGLFIAQFSNTSPNNRFYTSPNYTDSLYLIRNTNKNVIKNRNVITTNGTDVSSMTYKNRIYRIICSNHNNSESYIVFPIFNYNNYHAYDEAGREFPISSDENNKIQVAIPALYNGSISLRYEEPLSWRVCEIISLCTFIVFIWSSSIIILFHRNS